MLLTPHQGHSRFLPTPSLFRPQFSSLQLLPLPSPFLLLSLFHPPFFSSPFSIPFLIPLSFSFSYSTCCIVPILFPCPSPTIIGCLLHLAMQSFDEFRASAIKTSQKTPYSSFSRNRFQYNIIIPTINLRVCL
jgi:hypothetical protein